MAVPTAAKSDPMIPKMTLKACWKRARIPVKMEIIPVRIEDIKEAMESRMEAILSELTFLVVAVAVMAMVGR